MQPAHTTDGCGAEQRSPRTPDPRSETCPGAPHRYTVARMRSTFLCLVTACVAVLFASGVALADSASLAITDSAGKSDPAAGVGRTATLSGSTASPKYLYVKWRASGGAACAPSASSDSGTVSWDGSWSDSFYERSANGNFTLKITGTWRHAGTYQFCIWIADNSTQSVTPISQTISFRAPTGTVSGSVNPASPMPGENTTLTVTGSSEAPKYAYAKIRSAGGAPCATSYNADTGKSLIEDRSVNGAFSLTATFTNSAAGDQLICMWVADSGSDGSPVAGPQPLTFTVATPPPPPPSCVVPSLAPGTPLPDVQNALTAAACSLGKKSYSKSRRYPRGTLIKLIPVAGTKLDNNSPVRLVLSSGAPCRVPNVRAGMKLSEARTRLAASGCTAGKVSRRRSRSRKGRVIAFAPSSGTSLPQGSAVGIVVSKGRKPRRHR